MEPLVWEGLYPFRRFFRLYIQRKFTSVRLYQSCVARISAHACVWSAIMTFISSLWIAFPLSEQLKIDRTEIIRWNWSSSAPPGPRENQDTVEKNEFYEWGIWRTIMRTMDGNSSICIKINSWLHRVSPAPLSITINFNSWPPPDLIWSNGAPPAPLPTTGPIQTNISTAGPPGRTSPAPIPIIGPYRPTSDQLAPRCNRDLASTFVNRPIGHKFWSYEGFFGGFHIEGYFHLFSFMGRNWFLFNLSYHFDR